MKQIYVILHNIRSAHNVGSIFRTADAAGVEKVFLTGYTPAPVDQFGRTQKEIAKTALGAEGHVAWERVKRSADILKKLKGEGFEVVAVEQASQALDYKEFTPREKRVFIFGNEVRGLSRALLDASDAVVEIPVKGKKESLNVSVSAGIVLFHYR